MPQDMLIDAPRVDPPFDLTRFFDGHTRAWGLFEDRFGRVRRRFSVDMHGRWDAGNFVLEEAFVYDTGEQEHRQWCITPRGGDGFTAKSADCIGEASGRSTRDGVHMRYRFRLKTEVREIDVTFDDRIYPVDATVAINRATVRKWGIRLGEVSLFFVRRP